ncbi:MAG: hypothetical protein Q7R70_04210 [Candidatus Diapherotrites archaeon]|nr:hypothetical protein [Candidatus Diapherotrites archaeon]
MANFPENGSIKEFQQFINEVYDLPNDRGFELAEMLANVHRFVTLGIKGIRQGNPEKAKLNFLRSLSWYTSMATRLHIDIEDALWQRFPYLCSYCGNISCTCKAESIPGRRKVDVIESKRPKTMHEFQEMFKRIYPPASRSLEIAGIHLAEEFGELSDAILAFRGERRNSDFETIMKETADYLSTVFGIFNSLNTDLAKELAKNFDNNCFACHKSPCECDYRLVLRFK